MNLKRLRLAMRFTQEALAHDVGTSSSYLSAIENGKSSPTLAVMDRIASALGVGLTHLITERIPISLISDLEVEVGAVLARPAITLARQPHRTTGRPRRNY